MSASGPGARWMEAETPGAPISAVIGARLWRNLPGLLGANLRFLGCCAPCGLLALLGLPALAVTIAPLTVGPAVIALVAAAARMAGTEPGGAGAVGRVDARRFWTGSVLATALLVAWHAQLVALRALVEHEAAAGVVSLWAAQVAVLALGGLVGIHAVPLVGLYGQGALQATRNGFVLAARHPGPTVATLGLVLGAGALTWSLAGAPLIILPAALALLAVSNTQRLVEAGGSGS
jgi:hypothetical protein